MRRADPKMERAERYQLADFSSERVQGTKGLMARPLGDNRGEACCINGLYWENIEPFR